MDANLAKAMADYGLGQLEIAEESPLAALGEVVLRLVAVEPKRLKLVLNTAPLDDPELIGVTLERAPDGWDPVSLDHIRDRGVDGRGVRQMEIETRLADEGDQRFQLGGEPAMALDAGHDQLRRALRL